MLQRPLPMPDTWVMPSLNDNIHAPDAVIVPEIVVRLPGQIEMPVLVIAATGRAFTVTVSYPVRSLVMEEQFASLSELIVYVDPLVGLTMVFQAPLPVPVTWVPSFNFNVHVPVAVIVPAIVADPPLQIKVEALVIPAIGRAFTVTVSEPVRSLPMEVQFASLSELMA